MDVVFLEGAINDRPSTCESAQRLLHCVEALVLTIRAVSPFATIVFVELAEWRKVIGMVVKNGNPGQLPYSTTAALHDPATCAAFRESTAKMTPLARDESTRAARVDAARSDPTWCLSSVKMNNRTVAGGAPLHEPVALAHSLPIVSLPHAIRAALDDHAQAGLAPLPPPPLVRSMEEAAQLCADSSNKGLRLVACDAFHVGRLGHTVAAALIAQLVERGREVARAAKHKGACAALRDHAVRVGGEAAMPEVRSIATAEQLATSHRRCSRYAGWGVPLRLSRSVEAVKSTLLHLVQSLNSTNFRLLPLPPPHPTIVRALRTPTGRRGETGALRELL